MKKQKINEIPIQEVENVNVGNYLDDMILYRKNYNGLKKEMKLKKSNIMNNQFEQLKKYNKYFEKSNNKTDFSEKERQSLAKKGQAMKDGSFPISNSQDLKDVIKSVGRAKNYEKAKNWIIKRAKQLSLEDLLPEDWNEIESSQENDLQKSIFDYNTKVKLEITGVELIDKLDDLKKVILQKIIDLKTKNQELVKNISIEPNTKLDEYEYRNIKDEFDTELKKYSYEMCWFDDRVNSFSHSSLNTIDSNGAKDKQEAQNCRNYNDNLYNIIGCKKDLTELRIYIENLNPEETYELSPEEAIKLKF